MANDIYFPGLGTGKKVNDNSYTIVNNPVNGKPSKIKISNFFETAYENGYITDFGDTSSNQEIYTNAATIEQLENCTYNNGTDGIEATLTKVGNGAFPTIDGVPTKPNNTYLIKNQVNQLENGVYELTTVGSGGTPWVLTRISLFDESSEVYPATVTVLGGVANGNTLFFQKTKIVTVGTSNIVFQRINTQSIPSKESDINVYLVDIATITALPACTYANGLTQPLRPGIGATLTANTNGVFPTLNGIDPTDYTSNSLKILVQDQVDDEHNGIYSLINIGSDDPGGAPWRLVRINMLTSLSIPKKVVCVSNSDSSEYGKFFACDNIEIANTAVGTDSITFTEISGGGDNFANADLKFTANRTHDLDGYKSTFKDAEIQITAEANTISEIPLEVFQMDTAPNVRGASIMKVQGNGGIIFFNGVTTTNINNGNGVYSNGQIQSTDNFYCGVGSGSSVVLTKGTVTIIPPNTGVGDYAINSAGPGGNEAFSVRGNGYVIMKYVPEAADDAAAAALGVPVPVGGVYHTAGVLKVRLV